MPRLLLQRYGRTDKYTPGQIKKTIEDCELNQRYIHYAYAIFLTREELNALSGAPGITQDFGELRSEVADRFYGGDADFNVEAVMNLSLGTDGFGSFGDGAGGGD